MRTFRNDYSEGAAPHILDALVATNDEQWPGYTEEGDAHCEHARELIRAACGRSDVAVEFCIGGTSANVIGITGMLNDWEGVICTRDAQSTCTRRAPSPPPAGPCSPHRMRTDSSRQSRPSGSGGTRRPRDVT